MKEPAVELVHVSKHFGDVIAVNDVSLKIEDGEFFSLLGPSGCELGGQHRNSFHPTGARVQ